MNITTEELLQLIGAKEVMIVKLTMELARINTKIAELENKSGEAA